MEENKNPFGEQAGIPPKQTTENVPEVITPPEENILPENEITETTNTAKENDMEVHHHTHAAHGKKNWKSYFWEFLMLFLAVFCGFLAEYQLEHVIENQREKKYMQSFIYDLQNDTANLREGFPRKDQRVVAIDSVFLFFEENPNAQKIPGYVYRNMQRTLWDRHYRRNTTTNDQLKNAGGMRLIRKKNVADSIAAYDLQWTRAEFRREAYFATQQKGKDFITTIINPKSLLKGYRKDTGLSSTLQIGDTVSIEINRTHLYEFLVFLSYQKISTRQDKRDYMAVENSAGRLIELIKKEYHLK